MDIIQAIVLAIVQGLTEFLPVSSSAHLILIPQLLGWPDQGLVFDVAVHVGTLLAVVWYLRADLTRMIPAWFSGWRHRRWNADGRLAWFVIAATIPVAVAGLFGNQWVEAHLRNPMVIAATTLGFGLLLGWSDRRAGLASRRVSDLNLRDALLIGSAQMFALIPGTSRSGVTMTAGLMLGLTRRAAARFSFLLGIPAIALPGLLKSVELSAAGAQADWTALVVGVAVSATTAFLCIKLFMRFVSRVGMLPFVIYRVALALLIVAVFF